MKNNLFKELRTSLLTALWFMVLTFPIMVLKVNTRDESIQWRWINLIVVGLGTFFLSWLWRFMLSRKEKGGGNRQASNNPETGKSRIASLRRRLSHGKPRGFALGVLGLLALVLPLLLRGTLGMGSMYQIGIITSALMFVILGLGLNIVIGYGGLLHLGYAAFYAVGAYNYGLMYLYWGIPFWAALPLGAVSGLIFGLIIGVPVLRLRGDYLAIVTLAFGEIVRLLLQNMSGFTRGPEGIAQIPRPGFFMKLSLLGSTTYLYYIVLVLVVLTIIVIRRIEDSRLGRSLEAMREDEIAAQSMGIDLTKAKLSTFALGAIWAGMVGVLLAAKTTYINPGSFTLMESVMILVAVVLGGTGSIPGVIFGAMLVVLIPEYFRALADYRMLMFGVALVVMSIYRPQGIIPRARKKYIVSTGVDSDSEEKL